MSTENSHASANSPVIIVGAGLSGLAAAIGAALAGRRAVVFEAADLVGGAAAYSGGQVWIGANHVAARDGIEDTLEQAETYVRDIAHDDPSLLDEVAMKRWLETAPAAIRYWEEVGAIRLDRDPRAHRLPLGGRRGARRGAVPDQRADRRPRPRRLAGQAAAQPALPDRRHL